MWVEEVLLMAGKVWVAEGTVGYKEGRGWE